jgi:hypothetical protein
MWTMNHTSIHWEHSGQGVIGGNLRAYAVSQIGTVGNQFMLPPEFHGLPSKSPNTDYRLTLE